MDWYKFYNMDQKLGLSKGVGDTEIPARLDQIKMERSKLLEEEGKLIEKGLNSYNPDVLIKATSAWNDVQNKSNSDDIKGTLFHPEDFLDNSQGYKEKSFTLTGTALRRIAKSTPIIRAIITTRQAQISEFSRPQKNKYQTGFIIRKKGDYFSDQMDEMSQKDKNKVREIADFLINGGNEKNSWYADNFDTFLKKITEDSLTLDSACFEVVRSKIGMPLKYVAVDGSTIYHAESYDDETYKGTAQPIRGYYPSYVQVIDRKIYAEYYPWELCFGKRNTSTDIYQNGYGRPELQDLVSIVTWMLYGDQYNGKFFTQGAAPRGLLKVSGNVNRTRLNQFRNSWQSMVAGVENAWKVPLIESDKMEWIDLQKSNNDMQFSQWQEYLIKVSCAIFKIAPEEVGFSLGNASGGSAMFEGNNETKLKYSRDKGLRPLLKSIEFWINKYIVGPLDQDFEFVFVGIDQKSESEELDLLQKKVANGMGYKEYRKALGLPEELEEGDFPLNAVYAQMTQQIAMQKQMEENTDFVDSEEKEDVEEWKKSLDAEIAKNIQNSIPGHEDNPMMKEALLTFKQLILE